MKHLHMWRKHLPRAQYVNLYGPTEITCNCTYYRIMREFGPEEKIPAGRPFPNEKVFLLSIGRDGEVPDAEVLTEEADFGGAETEITKPGDKMCIRDREKGVVHLIWIITDRCLGTQRS